MNQNHEWGLGGEREGKKKEVVDDESRLGVDEKRRMNEEESREWTKRGRENDRVAGVTEREDGVKGREGRTVTPLLNSP